ncbi:hypothetical protein AEYBE204_02360 [Asticcacaulis sp. YBE204]|nr:hypothetical protein AEYBE204_02360 [Asticcacaulis sp. YBE204]
MRFSKIASGFNNGFAVGRELQADEETEFLQLRPTNMDSEGRWLFEKLTYLDEGVIPTTAKSVSNGDIVFNNTNSQQLVGKTGVWDGSQHSTMLLSNHMTQIMLNSGYNPEVYAFVLNIYRENRVFFNLCTNWNNQSGFAGERLRALPIPLLPPADQQLIYTIIDVSRKNAKIKHLQADALLASIDDYLLSELGIVLPPEPKSTIANRMFRTNAHELAGWRFDARVHQYDFNLKSGKHPNARLGTICTINPKTVFRDLTDRDEVSFIPMDAISDRLGIIERREQRILAENIGYTSFRNGDLLWAKITPCMENGKSAVAYDLHNGFGYGSTEYHVLRSPDDRLDVGYLHALLRMKRVRKAATRFFTGSSGHQRVDADFLRTLEIPIPPIAFQRELAEQARSHAISAIQLEAEANAELEKAKRKIEAILLGDAA